MKEFLVPQIPSGSNGNTVATTAAVASATLNLASGTRYILVTCELGKEFFLKPFSSAGAAPADAALMHFSDAMNGFILNVAGCDRIRHLRKGAVDVLWFYTALANT